MADQDQEITCSFCGKKEDKIKKITLNKRRIFICDDCLTEFKKKIDGDDDFELPLSIKETRNLELDRKLAELSIEYQIAAIDLAAFDLDPEAVKLIPASLCMEHCFVSVSKAHNNLIVAIADPSTIDTVKKVIEKNTGLEIEFVVANKQAIIDKIPHDIQ